MIDGLKFPNRYLAWTKFNVTNAVLVKFYK